MTTVDDSSTMGSSEDDFFTMDSPQQETFERFEEYDTARVEASAGATLMYDNPNAAEHLDRAALFRSFLMEMSQNDTSMMIDYSTTFPRPATNYVKMISVIICNVLGGLCLLLNLFVIFALIRNRRRVLRNVFYVLVLHCAIVDLIRGTCLIAWGMPHLVINHTSTMRERLLALKINQFTLVILRSCNLLTIFNLLVFTTNEFIVIKYPLHYRRCFRRRTVLMILAASWLISLFFAVGSVFSNFFESAHSVLVLNNNTVFFRNGTDDSSEVTRRELAGISINVVSMLMIFVLCYLCLFIVLICYGTILRTIRRFHSFDTKGGFHSEESQRITNRSIYCKHDDSLKTNASNSTDFDGCGPGNGIPSTPNRRCNSHRKWRTHLMSRHKYLIVIGTVLFVDVLFLFPYSGIQLVAFLHLNNMLTTSPKSTMIRWGLQILIGIHSVCQPLCYFRMNEFRRLACCSQKPLNRSKSFSQTKDQIGTNEEELAALKDNQSRDLLVCEPLIKHDHGIAESDDDHSCNHTGSVTTKLDSQFLGTNWTRIGSSKFRRYGPQDDIEAETRQKLSTLSGLRSSTACDPESFLERADDLGQQQPQQSKYGGLN
uniref:G-protein coupled receptors family 1 profile domain-containing protein n=1 Tax=Panagrolaimus superbus TaxID=310955 RepID=A0A914Y9K2_9BILA